jgi:hypothetical protein
MNMLKRVLSILRDLCVHQKIEKYPSNNEPKNNNKKKTPTQHNDWVA